MHQCTSTITGCHVVHFSRLTYLLLAGVVSATPVAAAELSRDAVRLSEVQRKERFWKDLSQSDPAGKTGCRQIMGYALALAEARVYPERLARLFELLNRMQDRNPQSKTYGNLRWRWADAAVDDNNAVEFCMHDAILLWKRHHDWIPAQSREQLRLLMQFGLEGVLRHRVPTTYTNIALTRAANLILLGEIFKRDDLTKEGHRQLDDFVTWTAAHGIHEFVSPTYYAIDINALTLLATQSQNDHVRLQAGALLKLLWTDIALNWFPASERLGGANSRTYDYLAGRGALDWYLWVNGWFPSATPGKAERVEPYWNEWTPPPDLRALSVQRLPRLVRQSWGKRPEQSRTYMVYRDIGLSTLGASYGAEDVPLAIDLPGPRDAPRAFFRADGEQNPYGAEKHASGAGRQRKATHLTPFWIGAQRTKDALAAAIFDAKSAAPQCHLVLPRNAQSIMIGGSLVDLAHKEVTTTLPIQPGQPLVLRYGTAAVGVRVLSATTRDSRAAPIALVDDNNPYGCLRLTADLTSGASPGTEAAHFPLAAVVLGVRVGTGLNTERKFTAWRQEFENARPARLVLTDRQIDAEISGVDGPLSVKAELNDVRQPRVTKIVPEPTRCVLELDGKEIGRPLLDVLAPHP